MDRKTIDKYSQLWQEVVEKKKLDPVGKADADIDNDGDVDKSDEYLHNRRKAIKKAMKEDEGMKPCPECDGSVENHDPDCPKAKTESKDMDDDNSTKALKHDCAKHVTSEQWGFGECISGEHTLVEQEDGTAIVTHYDVMFEHGVEFDVPVEALDILVSESHLHASKKKGVKEGKTHAERTKGGAAPEGMMDKQPESAKKFAKDHEQSDKEMEDKEKKGHEDATKAGRVTKQSPTRGGEKRMGDTSIVNPVKDAVTSTTGKE